MGFLRFLEGLRTPFLDTLFSLITHLGEETVLILIGLIFYWCIDKKKGYYVLSVGFIGTIINQFLKLLFRVPRPWIKDPSFTIVESARAEATGYSFPSGHTQTSVGLFGSIALLYRKKKLLFTLCIIAAVLTSFSRLYLGVHTLLDVGVSIGLALLLIFGLYPLIMKAAESPKGMYIYLGSLLGVSVLYLLFVLLFPFPADIDPENYASGVKNAYKILGCMLGLLLAYELDRRYIRFETDATLLGQALKLLLGLIPILAIKEGLRAPLELLFNGSFAADGVRYFLICLVAGGVWPLTFPLICRLTEKKKR